MAATNIRQLKTALEFDTAIYNGGEHFWYDSTHVVFAYSGAANDGYIEVFAIDANGTITSPGTRFEFDTTQGNHVRMKQVDSTHYIVWWQGTDGDGFAQVMTLNTGTWSFTAEGTPLEFDIDTYTDGSAQQVDSNHFLLTWAGTGTDGFAQIFTVNLTTWAVTVEGTALEFDTTRGDQNSLVQLTSTHYLNCYSSAGSDGFAQVLAVNTSTWAVTAVGTPFEFDADIAEHTSAVAISSTHVLIFWRGTATQIGQAMVVAINNSTWAVTAAGAKLTFESTLLAAKSNSAFHLRDNIYINAWAGTDDDGFIQAFEVNLSTWAVSAYGDKLEFDPVNGLNSHAFEVSDSRLINAWSGEAADGYIQAFDMVTVLAEDDFTRADGAIGANWSNLTGVWDITSNKAEVDTLSGGLAIAAWNGTFNTTDADYWVTADVQVNSAATTIAIIGRIVDSSNFYILAVSTFDQTLYLAKVIAGSFTNLDTFVGGYTAGVTYKLTLAMNGNELQGYVNDVLTVSATDSEFTAVGDAGIWGDATTNTVDNFMVEGYETVTPPVTGGAIIDFIGGGIIPFAR